MRRRNVVCSAVAVALMGAAVAGCSSGGSGRAAASGSSGAGGVSTSSADPATPTASTSPTAPTTGADATTPTTQPPTTSAPSTSPSVSPSSGSYLKTLLPVSATESMLGLGPTLPTGWVANTGHERDSGPAATAAAPSLVNPDNCNYLTAQDLDLAEGLSVGNATEPLSNGSASVGLALYAYGPGDAAKSLAQVRQSLASSCDGFTALENMTQVSVDVSATPVSGLGDEALLVKVTPKGAYVDQENLVVRRGNLMLSLTANNVFGPLPDLSPVAAALVAEMG